MLRRERLPQGREELEVGLYSGRGVYPQQDKEADFYVVWTGRQGVFAWPAVRISDCYITLDMTVPMLMVEHIYDLSEYEVVPHEAVSPLFLYLEGKINSESFGIVLKHSHPVPLLEFNAKMGFPNIEEKS